MSSTKDYIREKESSGTICYIQWQVLAEITTESFTGDNPHQEPTQKQKMGHTQEKY